MNRRQIREPSRWLGDVRSVMSSSRRVVAQTLIGFDRSSPHCREVADELEALASSIDRKLAAAIRPVEIDAGRLVAFTPEALRLEAWQELAETMLVFLPKGPSAEHRPALTLVLPGNALQNAGSRVAMLQQLGQLQEAYASIVCVFVEGNAGEELRQACDEASWQGWLTEVAEAVPNSVVRFYLVGGTASDGRLLTSADQAAVAAHAIFADLVLRDRSAPRYLAQSQRRPEASVGVLGMTGQLLSAEAASHCLAPRLCRELVEEQWSRQPVAVDDPQDLPTDPFRLLVQAFQHPMPFDATAALERAESPDRHDYEAPSLVGYDFRFTVNVGKAAKALCLDGVPPDLWRSRLVELDLLVSSERAGAIAARACEYLDQLRIDDERRIQDVLRETFALRLCDGPVRAAADRFIDRISKHRETVVVSGDQEDIAGSLNRMDTRVQELGCWRRGLFATLLALLLALAVIWACNTRAMGAIRVWGTILPAAAVAAIGLGAAGRWCWARHVAGRARDDVLEQIQRRTQHAICQRMQEELERTATRLHNSTRTSGEALCEAIRDIVRAAQRSGNGPETQVPLIDRPRPDSDQMESIYRFALHRPTEYVAFVDKFRERCRDLAEELIHGTVAPTHALASLHAHLHNELMLLLSNRLDVWRLYCEDSTASSFDDATFFRRVGQWSVPVYCGTGSALAGREGNGFLAKTSWICPDALASRVASHADTALLPMDDRVLALHRWTLARMASAGPSDNLRSGKAVPAYATEE